MDINRSPRVEYHQLDYVHCKYDEFFSICKGKCIFF